MRSTTIYTTVLIGLVFTSCMVGCYSKANYWQARVDQVRVGMPRSEVESLLPPYSASTTLRTGGGQGLTYWLDPEWKISISYDYTGIVRDQNGTAQSHDSPENKVTSRPRLSREALRTIEVTKLEIIEQPDQPDKE